MKKMMVVIAFVITHATTAMAEEKRPFTGLYASVGQYAGDGNFTLSHHSPKFSFGPLLDVPVSGTVTAYEVGYRFPIGESNLRFGLNGILHKGDMAGSESWQGYGVTAGVAVASQLRLSLGVELGAVVDKKQRLYLYAGAGKVASDLSLLTFIDTPFGDWTGEKSGNAVGSHYRIGIEYQFSKLVSGGIEISQMKFDAAKAFGLGDMGPQSLNAELKETLIGVKLVVRW